MAQRVLSVVTVIVALLLVLALGLAVYRAALGQPVLPRPVALGQGGTAPDVLPPDLDGSMGTPSGFGETGVQPQEENSQPPGGDDARQMIIVLATQNLPGWSAKIVSHDDEWRSATVRVTSPEGSVSLDLGIIWDEELSDYAVASALPAKTSSAATASSSKTLSGVPAAVVAAIKGHPRLGKLTGAKFEPKKITSAEALVILRAKEGVWRVYLKRRGDAWAVINARKLEQ